MKEYNVPIYVFIYQTKLFSNSEVNLYLIRIRILIFNMLLHQLNFNPTTEPIQKSLFLNETKPGLVLKAMSRPTK